jgi:hypothetical protein
MKHAGIFKYALRAKNILCFLGTKMTASQIKTMTGKRWVCFSDLAALFPDRRASFSAELY